MLCEAIMNYDELWAYSYDRVRAYLLGSGAKETAGANGAAGATGAADSTAVAGHSRGGTFTLPDCTVVIGELPDRYIGGLAFPQTRVQINGPGADPFHHEFKLHFLSGGG